MPPSAPSTGAAVCLGPTLPDALLEVLELWVAAVPVLVVVEALVVELPVLVVADVVVTVPAELEAGVVLVDWAPPLVEVDAHETVLGTLTFWA